MCVSRPHQEIPKCKDVPQIKTKSKSQKDRDSRRIQEYFDSKSFIRSLPFANLRDSAFRSCLDSSSIIKRELTSVKEKLSTVQKKGESQTAEILKLREQLLHFQSVSVENEKLRADVLSLQDNQQRQSINEDNCQIYVKRINDLEVYLQRKSDFIFDIQQKYEEISTEKRQFFNENSILHFKVDEYYKQIGELNNMRQALPVNGDEVCLSEDSRQQDNFILSQLKIKQSTSHCICLSHLLQKALPQRKNKHTQKTKFDNWRRTQSSQQDGTADRNFRTKN
ncbi:unnamed protein product [Mytilus edulis]|uniref:Uncharacterized protein n=1 Tax=Mytilus edulis TaxID=6550 RepID=A0A8S3TIY7_MYTED|nr:unnamed protein product [Mytilus edulis]